MGQKASGFTVEVIVVDDGSTDETEKAVKKFGERVIYKKLSHYGNPAKARNEGIKLSTGNFIAFLDADDVWLPSKIAEQLKFLKLGGYDMVHSDASVVNGSDQVIRESLHGRSVIPSGKVFSSLYLDNSIITSTVLIKKCCLDAAGLFSQNKDQWEDYDLWLRIASRFSIGYLDKKLIFYREQGGSLSDVGMVRSKELEFKVLKNHFQYAKSLIGSSANVRILQVIKPIVVKLPIGDVLHKLRYSLLLLSYIPLDLDIFAVIWKVFKRNYNSHEVQR